MKQRKGTQRKPGGYKAMVKYLFMDGSMVIQGHRALGFPRRIMLSWVLLLIILLLYSLPAHAEMYQYKGDDGRMYFTDDISRVPPDQRDAITSMPSVKGAEGVSSAVPGDNGVAQEAQGQGIKVKNISPGTAYGTWDEEMDRKSRELDGTREALDITYKKLMDRKAALMESTPEGKVSPDKMREYREAIDILNADIAAYQVKQRAFKADVEAFNARIAGQASSSARASSSASPE
ncbi:MAG: DUF4124 domain-containing protein [Desulfamplus sp.]|nr:DUF4124 domain-containing protein [Desulfamplus sp.]